MRLIITADLHLDHNPDHEYRWKALDMLENHLRRDDIDAAVIAGDLVDAKDRHPAKFVNRVVDRIASMASESGHVVVMKGNHDYVDPACPFFRMLGHIPHVYFFTKPHYLGVCGVLYIPHGVSWAPGAGWRSDFPLNEASVIFAHETFNGCRASNGSELPGISLATVGRKATGGAPVIAGDIHVPQQIGNVTYVGAPHAVNFGDDYEPRMLIWDSETGKMSEVRNPGIKRMVAEFTLDADGVPASEAAFGEGDHVKARFLGEQRDLAQWPEIRERIRGAIERRGARSFGEEYLVDRPQVEIVEAPEVDARDDAIVFAEYCEARGVDPAVSLAVVRGWFDADSKVEAKARRVDFALRSIAIRGFRSFIDDVAFRYPDTPGVYLLTGKNGVGKSSFFEAVFWVLYGRLSTGLAAKQVANWAGDVETSVVLDVLINGRLQAITRRWKPNALTVQRGLGEPETVDQVEVERLVGLSREQFLATAYYPQDGDRFMRMLPSAQLAKVSELLGLGRWDERVAAARASLKSSKASLVSVQSRVDRAEASVDELCVQREDAKTRSAEWQQERDRVKYHARWRLWLDGHSCAVQEARERFYEEERRHDSYARSLEGWKQRLNELLASDAAECPTCGAELEPLIDEEKTQREVDLVEARTSVEQARKAHVQHLGRVVLLKARRDEASLAFENAQNYRDKGNDTQDDADLDREIAAIEVEDIANPFAPQLEGLTKRSGKAQDKLEAARAELLEVQGDIELAKHAAELYAKTKVSLLERAALEFETYVANALPQLGLDRWGVRCVAVDLETGEAKWKIQISAPGAPEWVDFRAWSGGERTRLCLAGDAAFSDLARARCGVSVPFEIWDEPTTWIDVEGLDDVMSFFRWRSRVLEKQVWLIEHRTKNAGEVDTHWTVTQGPKGTAITPA